MDDLQCSGEVVNQTLRELEVINRWLGGNAVTLQGIKKILRGSKGTSPLRIADIGCGGGDVLMEIAKWGRRKKIPMELFGVDANPHIISFAKDNAKDYPEISFLAQNIFSEEFRKSKFDIVMATLFTHHFTNQEFGELLKSLRSQCSIGIVINDLHRHWLAYYAIKLLTKWFSKSSMVKYDGPISVLRSFSRADLESILHSTGMSNYALSWKWAFRWQLIIPTSLA